jgi:exopolysaccharide biosynthesis polyprenyl glycosylphosphotransferase
LEAPERRAPYVEVSPRARRLRVAGSPARPYANPHRRLTRLLEGRRWLAVRFVSDAVMLVLATVLAIVVGPHDSAAALLALVPPLALSLLYSRGRYRQRLRDVAVDSIAPGFGAISIAAMTVFVLVSLVYGAREASSPLVAITWIASLVGVTSAGFLLTAVQYVARKRRLVSSPTLIIGIDAAGTDIARRLAEHPEYGLDPVGFLDGSDVAARPDRPPLLGDLGELEAIASAGGVRNVIVAFPTAPYRQVLALVKRCDELGLETMVLPRLFGSINHQTQFEYLGTLPVLNLRTIDLDGWRFAIKSLIDRLVAGLLLLVLSPLLIAVAIAVRLSSRGPVLFRQLRAGRDGQLFNLFKFRTMVEPTADEASRETGFTVSNGLAPGGVEGVDRRTRLGRVLRRTSLDELPQLFNVLRGDMSLVGPRPERPEFAELFDAHFERYHDRRRVRSGITGWAQVHGYRGQTPLAERLEFDNFYIEHWSLTLDIKILLLTLPALLKGLLAER